MGRGLGQLQQSILDYLQAQGKPCWVYDIPLNLYTLDDPHVEGEPVIVPYAFYTSVRRAINALERRGLVFCGLPAEKHYRREERLQRICWLPGQFAPRCKARLQSTDVERAIIDRILSALAITDQRERDHIFKELFRDRMQPPHEGCVSYAWLVGKVIRDLGCTSRWDDARFKTAITRAINSLIEQGILTGYKRPNGWYGWIRLNVAM